MIYICKVCGKRFTAKRRNQVTCSTECSQLYLRHRYIYDPEYRAQRKKRDKSHYVRKQKQCEICGNLLPDARQKFCIDCLLNMYLYGDKRRAIKLLDNRGYDKSMIQDLIREKGLIL